MSIITLTTDFGTVDGYVGAMKGVILSYLPDAKIVDVSHEIPAHDVAAAAFSLAQAAPFFPDGTVHVVVVDPGVGGARHPVAVDDGRHRFVGPDNGLFARAVPAPRAAHVITDPAFRRRALAGEVSPTFHGRDLFAVCAARLAAGAPIAAVGPPVTLAGSLVGAPPRRVRGAIVGRVIHIDRFGNAITDLAGAPPGARVVAGAFRVSRVSRTYEDVPRGKPLAYVGSGGTLELAVREGSAAARYRLRRGATVRVIT